MKSCRTILIYFNSSDNENSSLWRMANNIAPTPSSRALPALCSSHSLAAFPLLTARCIKHSQGLRSPQNNELYQTASRGRAFKDSIRYLTPPPPPTPPSDISLLHVSPEAKPRLSPILIFMLSVKIEPLKT